MRKIVINWFLLHFFIWGFIFSTHMTKKLCLVFDMYKCMICRRQSPRLLYVMNFILFRFAFVFFFIAGLSEIPIVYQNSLEFWMFINVTSRFFFVHYSLVLFTHTPLGSAIKCFECNSHYNQGCEVDDVPSNFSVDCSLKQDRDDRNKPIQYTLCRKVLQVIEFSVNQCK